MSYMGNVELKASNIRRFDVTGSTSATHTLTWTAPNEQSLIVTINGVKQQNNYTVSGTTLTLDTALITTDALEVIGINDVGTTITPAQGSVNADQLATGAVTSTKIADGTIVDADINASAAIAMSKLATDPTNASNLASGTVPTARLGSGTADSTTFLRGDQTYASAGLSGWSEDGADNDLLPASASAGIYLGVNSATAANLLDDYETGTWTCSFTNPGSVTGYYVKVGNLCHVSAKISTSGGASGTSFGGLPFTTASSDDYRSSGGVGYQNSTAGVWNPLTNSSNTTFNFFIADATQEMGSTGRTTYFSLTYPTS